LYPLYSPHPLIGGNRKDRRRLFAQVPFRERQQDHEEKEHPLRVKVPVVDPEKVIAIGDRNKGVVG
jgi:hypothetical protein